MKKIFKTNLKNLIIFILLTILISFPYFNSEPITTHDISYHTNRIINIANELSFRNFPVLIHSSLLNNFGYANSLFYPELFLYFPALLILCGVHFLTSYKILTFVSTFFTLIFTYYSAYRIFNKKNIAWSTSILYTASFYRISDLYVRGALGEILAMTFLPLVLLGLYEIIFGDYKKWWIICFGIFGIINSHVLTSVLTLVFIFLICLFNIKKLLKDKKRLFFLFIAGIVSILLSLSFIMPYLEQSFNDIFKVDKEKLDSSFIASYALNIKELLNNELYSIDSYKGNGLFLLILPFLLFFFKEKSNQNLFMRQIFIIGFILLILTTKIIPWEYLCDKYPAIATIQFPYRLNILITLSLSFISGYAICNVFKNKDDFNYLIYILLIISTLNLISNVEINFANYIEDIIINLSPIGNAEYEPFGLNLDDTNVHNIYTTDSIKFTRNGSKIEFYYDNEKDDMLIHIPLTYYKGYVAYIIDENNNKTMLSVLEDDITKNVLVGSDSIIKGNVTVEYKITTIQLVSYIITLVTFISLIVYIFINKKEAN